jgi:CheY-like chemotaxis protein
VSGAVLVVDDDPVFRSLARRTLIAEGLVVVGEAESVATAMAAAHALRPDAVLVDVGLPDGDGVALARALTALPWRPRVVLRKCVRCATTPWTCTRAPATTSTKRSCHEHAGQHLDAADEVVKVSETGRVRR